MKKSRQSPAMRLVYAKTGVVEKLLLVERRRNYIGGVGPAFDRRKRKMMRQNKSYIVYAILKEAYMARKHKKEKAIFQCLNMETGRSSKRIRRPILCPPCPKTNGTTI